MTVQSAPARHDEEPRHGKECHVPRWRKDRPETRADIGEEIRLLVRIQSRQKRSECGPLEPVENGILAREDVYIRRLPSVDLKAHFPQKRDVPHERPSRVSVKADPGQARCSTSDRPMPPQWLPGSACENDRASGRPACLAATAFRPAAERALRDPGSNAARHYSRSGRRADRVSIGRCRPARIQADRESPAAGLFRASRPNCRFPAHAPQATDQQGFA